MGGGWGAMLRMLTYSNPQNLGPTSERRGRAGFLHCAPRRDAVYDTASLAGPFVPSLTVAPGEVLMPATMLWARALGKPFVTGKPTRASHAVSPRPSPPHLLRRPHRHPRASLGASEPSDGKSSDSQSNRGKTKQERKQLCLSELADILRLVALLPPTVRDGLDAHPELLLLVEVVMDLGRPPVARFPAGDVRLAEEPVSEADLQYAVAQVGDFGGDNRAGIDKTLHRISCIRNRAGKVVGLTCRVGRAIQGSADMVEDLIQRSCSILMLGRPGVGKTTAIREISRKLADDCRKRVVIVDTSNEIGGDGDIPHPGIGSARRMQVPQPDQQHRVMIEAVENHTPEVIVIDEIGTEAEALAARTIAQRGVQLVATAHGNELENVMKNPSLNDLVGGISSVTLGDEEAKRRGVQKSILERAAPPTFDVAVEMASREQWRVHLDVGRAVDMLLFGQEPVAEVRERDANGKVWSWPENISDSDGEDQQQQQERRQPLPAQPGSSRASPRQPRQQASSSSSITGGSGDRGFDEAIKTARQALVDPRLGTYAGQFGESPSVGGSRVGGRIASSSSSSKGSDPSGREDEARVVLPTPPPSVAPAAVVAQASPDSTPAQPGTRQGSSSAKPAGSGALRLYTYGVDAGSIWSVGSALRLEGRLELCQYLEEADAVLALRSKLKTSAWVKQAAQAAGIPVFSIKSAGVGDVVKALRTLLGIDPSPGGLFADEGAPVAADPKISNSRNSRAEASIALVAAAGMKQGRQRGGGKAAAAAVAVVAQQQADASKADALEEARLAVEQFVIPRGQPIELLPRDAPVLEAQIQLLLGYRLPFELVGASGSQRLRVMPPGYSSSDGGGGPLAAVEAASS